MLGIDGGDLHVMGSHSGSVSFQSESALHINSAAPAQHTHSISYITCMIKINFIPIPLKYIDALNELNNKFGKVSFCAVHVYMCMQFL